MLISAACWALGDADAARMESAAGRSGLERLGAMGDLAAGPAPGPIAGPLADRQHDRQHDRQPLTARECEILRLVAPSIREFAEGGRSWKYPSARW